MLKFWVQTRKLQDKQNSKIVYSINGSWYFNKINTFSPFEEEGIGSIQFNGEIINMMLPTKVSINFNSQVFDIKSASLTSIMFSDHLQVPFTEI